MMDDTESIQKLLAKVKHITDIDDKVQEERRKRGELFNVFNVIGLWSEEVRLHSAFLAELLNPDGSHGLQDAFLKEFICAAEISDLKFQTSNSTVSTEYYIGKKEGETGGRIDILIQSEDKAIIIENKIYALDQENQLLRYKNFGDSKYAKKYKLLYLTLDCHKASENSTKIIPEMSDKDSYYRCISYSDCIMSWLERCAQIAYRQPLVRESIRQYQLLIKQLTYKDMDSNNRDKMISFLSQKDNIESVARITSLFNDIRKEAIQKYVVPQLKSVAERLDLDFSLKDNKLDFASKGQQIDFPMYFSVKNSSNIRINYIFCNWNLINLSWGIDANSSIPQREKFDIFDDSNNQWPWGWKLVDDKFRNWNDPDTLNRIVKGEFAQEVEKDLSLLIKELKDKNLID
jgi:DNA-binding sugar fermentation-stimulating protein